MSLLWDCFGRNANYSSTIKPRKVLADSSCEEVPSEQKGEGLKTKDIWDLCNQGDHDGVRNVLEKGESPNLKRRYSLSESKVLNRTCLIAAVRGQHMKVVELLLKQRKTDVNFQDDQGMAALHYACVRENTQIIEMLLSHPKVNPNVREWNGDRSPIELAVIGGHLDAVQILLASSQVRVDMKNGISIQTLAG